MAGDHYLDVNSVGETLENLPVLDLLCRTTRGLLLVPGFCLRGREFSALGTHVLDEVQDPVPVPPTSGLEDSRIRRKGT